MAASRQRGARQPDSSLPGSGSQPEVGPPDVLDLAKPFACLECGKTSHEGCPRCEALDPPGMHLIHQDRGVYGWSESNVRYELIGVLKPEAEVWR